MLTFSALSPSFNSPPTPRLGGFSKACLSGDCQPGTLPKDIGQLSLCLSAGLLQCPAHVPLQAASPDRRWRVGRGRGGCVKPFYWVLSYGSFMARCYFREGVCVSFTYELGCVTRWPDQSLFLGVLCDISIQRGRLNKDLMGCHSKKDGHLPFW